MKDAPKNFSLNLRFFGEDGTQVERNVQISLNNVKESEEVAKETVLEKLSDGTVYMKAKTTETWVDGELDRHTEPDTVVRVDNAFVPLSTLANNIENWTEQAGGAGQVLGSLYLDGFFPKNIEFINDPVQSVNQVMFRNQDNGHEITFLEMTRMYSYYKEQIRKFGAPVNMSAMGSEKTTSGIGMRAWITDWVTGPSKSWSFLAQIIHRGVEECRLEQKKRAGN